MLKFVHFDIKAIAFQHFMFNMVDLVLFTFEKRCYMKTRKKEKKKRKIGPDP